MNLFSATMLFIGLVHAAENYEWINRACNVDTDCVVVTLGCHCMYCARPDDLKNRVAEAVNKKVLKRYEEKYKCSSQQTAACATAGPCAVTGQSVPACTNHRCTIHYVPTADPAK